jgi:hypothetical protein
MPRKKSIQPKQVKHLQCGNRSISTGSNSPLDKVEGEGEKEDKALSSCPPETQSITARGYKNERSAAEDVDNQPSSCSICKGVGYISENGQVHTCWDCLNAGRLDNVSQIDTRPKEEIFHCSGCGAEVKFGDKECKCGRTQLWALFG